MLFRHLHGDKTLEQVNFKQLYQTNQLIKSNQTPISLFNRNSFFDKCLIMFDYCLFTKIIIAFCHVTFFEKKSSLLLETLKS